MDERKQILEMVREYAKTHIQKIPAGKVPVSGKVFDHEEMVNAVDAVLEGWWTESKYNSAFELALAKHAGVKHALTLNSGSSANLCALYALTSSKLGDKKLVKGDEVITAATGFPTTVNPIVFANAIPVFVDVQLGTYNPSAKDIEAAITDKTKAIIIAHTLGNPFEADKIRKIADGHGIWLIEDACDALGGIVNGKMVGSFGHLSTLSFYPAHQITTAEGGAILTDNPLLNKICRSMRDWGRDCWCQTGKDNSCGKRFSWKLGNLPEGYDHKYIYSETGFNFKMTDIQAAIGLAQMKKLPAFVSKRKHNFDYLNKLFEEKELGKHFITPNCAAGSEPSWFGFPITITDNTDRTELLKWLNSQEVATRLIFAGNITKQPYFINNKIEYRISEDLENTDIVMEKAFWIGVYPALEDNHLEYAASKIKEFLENKQQN
ncbi:lipopolysaccharide biosynthesis protein RfbH [Candidatus Micrarchaeota archaeon]|nr:lipopolysaccharide biosynthesis protein RfbH [Candidatus Micrarchaeota archaeon]